MATTEVYKFPHATVTATWPFDTPEEEERWLEGFKKATTKFLLAAYKDKLAKYLPFLESQGIKLIGSVNLEDNLHGEEEFQLKISTSLLTSDSSLIFNDHVTKELIVISIPANTFSVKSNGVGDLLVFDDDPEFLDLNINAKTLKDRKTGTDFSPCLVARIPYEYSNDKYTLRKK